MNKPCPVGAGDDPAPWREPVRGGHFDTRLAALPGSEQMRAMLHGDAPQPPLSHLIGLRALAFSPGTATFEMPVTGWLRGGDGEVPLGPLTIPTDAAMACAIITLLPPGVGITTTELSLRRLRAAEPGETLRIDATAIDTGPPVALADVRVTGAGDRLIAQGGSLCMRLPPLTLESDPAPDLDPAGPDADPVDPAGPAADPDEPDPSPPPGPAAARHPAPSADPWERPAPPALAPVPPLSLLTGLRCVTLASGRATCELPATPWLTAPPPGRVQGGAVAMLADAAISAAISSAAPEGVRFRAVEIKLNYVRPLASDGRTARADARLVHGGRRTAVGEARVHDADGRLIALATGSAVAAH